MSFSLRYSGFASKALLALVKSRSDLPAGAVAQLGERLLCKQEVVGSIPSSSTNFLTTSSLERTETATA